MGKVVTALFPALLNPFDLWQIFIFIPPSCRAPNYTILGRGAEAKMLRVACRKRGEPFQLVAYMYI